MDLARFVVQWVHVLLGILWFGCAVRSLGRVG
jgi:uncharacterized membrane protein